MDRDELEFTVEVGGGPDGSVVTPRGKDDVKNYDGSWTEWGNLVGVPVETGS